MRLKVDTIVQAEIDLLGDRVTIKSGTRHSKLYVDGILAAVIPCKPRAADPRASLNVRAALRQAAEGKTRRSGRWSE